MYYFDEISASEINWEDATYKLDVGVDEYKNESKSLFNSLIWLQKKEDSYRVVKGFNELKKHQKNKRISVVVYKTGVSDWDIWCEVVRDAREANTGSFLQILKSTFELFHVESIDEKKLLALFQPWGVKSKVDLEQVFSFCRNCFKVLEQIIDISKAGYNELNALCRFKSIPIVSLVGLFRGQLLHGKKLTSVLALIEEIERKSGDSWSPGMIEEIELGGADIPFNQYYKILKDRLIELRFPRLCKVRKEWTEVISQGNLPDGVCVEIDEYFEADSLRLVFTSDTANGLLCNTDENFNMKYGLTIEKLFKIIHYD